MEQKFINGHEYVDLGLPGRTLWATCNVGATKPEEYGDYFAWGETTPKSVYNEDTYKYGPDDDSITNYYIYSCCGIFENRSELALCYDAATVNWGKAWRMPTRSHWKELRQYCT